MVKSDRALIARALDSMVEHGVLIRYDFVDHGETWQLVRSEEGPAYTYTEGEVAAYIAGARDATDSGRE